MANRDYYDVLGASKSDTEEDIRKAFRKKAMEYHPDRNKSPDAEDKFKEVNEAYQVLSDSDKRAQYDRFGHAGVNANGGFDRPFDGFDVFGGFGDIFDSFFGDSSGRRTREAQRGGDIQQRVQLTFEEAIFGIEREIELSRMERCQRCSGAGNEPGTEIITCTTCRGKGQVRRAQRSIFGQFTQVTTCSTCRGKGSVIRTPCTSCNARGSQRKSRKIAVKIPAGVEAGMQVRIANEGDVGREGGPNGNLYVYLDVKTHAFFERDGFDLVYDLPVNLAEAALGVEKIIPTLDGDDISLKLPQGTQPGAEYRIRGKGIPHLNSNRRGDIRVLVDLQVPSSLTAEQRKLLESLAISLQNGQGGQKGQNNKNEQKRGARDNSGDEEADEDKDKGFFDKIKEVLS